MKTFKELLENISSDARQERLAMQKKKHQEVRNKMKSRLSKKVGQDANIRKKQRQRDEIKKEVRQEIENEKK
mgnify:CR=1 FL=1|tara:strand:+ start:244 stop:459 length:216 start_codon:yes stop_codon:yes gene_type:complete